LLIAIVTGLSEAIPQLIDYIPTIIDTMITTLLDNLPLIIDCAIQLLVALINGLIQALPKLVAMTPKIIRTIVTTLIKNLPQLLKAGKTLLTSVIDGIKSILSNMGEVGKNIVEGLWNGIKNAKDWLLNKIKSFASTITDGIKSFFGIHSPSTVFRDEIGKNLMLGLANGITGNEGVVSMAMSRVANGLSNTSFEMPNIVSGNILPYFANAISSNGISATENGVDNSSNGNIPINVQIMLDRRELGSAVVEVSQEEIRRTGNSLVKGTRLVIA
jgi:phage-related protein